MEQPEVKLLRLSRDSPSSGKYLNQVMERIRQTSRQFDGSSDALVNATWKLYAEASPWLGLWVAVNHQGDLIGHAVGDIEAWSGRMVAWISQVVMDEIAPKSLQLMFMDAVESWVREVNKAAEDAKLMWRVSEVLMMSPRMTDAWSRHAGFEPYRSVYRRIVR